MDLEKEKLIEITCESLLDDQCLLRNLFLDLQGQQRDMQGLLSSPFEETISLKQSVETLHARVEALEPAIDNSIYDRLLAVFTHVEGKLALHHKEYRDVLSKTTDFLEELPVNFSLLNSRLDGLNNKVNQMGKGRKEVSFVDKPPTESPIQEMVEELSRGIS